MPKKYVPQTVQRNMKMAAMITGKIASPLVLRALPKTRFDTRPISRKMSMVKRTFTREAISVLSVKSDIIGSAQRAKVDSTKIATTIPIRAAFLVPLSQASYSLAPTRQPVIIEFATASAAPME